MLFKAFAIPPQRFQPVLGFCIFLFVMGAFFVIGRSFASTFYRSAQREHLASQTAMQPASLPSVANIEEHRFRIVATDSLFTHDDNLQVRIIQDTETKQTFYVFRSASQFPMHILPAATVQPATVPSQH